LRGKSYSDGLHWVVGTAFKNGCYNISYYDNKAVRHHFEINIKDGQYTYEGQQTKNIYELLVNTSLGEKFLRSFPHQFVAVTDRALQLPKEEQPWFFGSIDEDEAKNILLGSVYNNLDRSSTMKTKNLLIQYIRCSK